MKSKVTILDVAAQGGCVHLVGLGGPERAPRVCRRGHSRGGSPPWLSQLGWVPSLRRPEPVGSQSVCRPGWCWSAHRKSSSRTPSSRGSSRASSPSLSCTGSPSCSRWRRAGGRPCSATGRWPSTTASRGLPHRHSRDDARVRLVTELGLPAVAVNSAPRCSPAPRCARTTGRAGRLWTEVIALGHRRVAHVAGRGASSTRVSASRSGGRRGEGRAGARPARLRRLHDRERQPGRGRVARRAGARPRRPSCAATTSWRSGSSRG